MHNIFFELTLILILAGGIATLLSFFRQPAIIAYILAGLVVGPLGYYQLRHSDVFQGLAEIGITLLLFLVGLELDVSQLKKFGRAAIIAGIAQVLLTLVFGFALMTFMGFSTGPSVFVALALTFSSTVITVKMLNDKKDLQSLYGRLAVGILLIQDFTAIALLILIGSNEHITLMSIASGEFWQHMLITIGKAVVMIWIIHWCSVHLFPRVLRLIGKSDELLLVFSLAWALGLASFVSLPFIGFNVQIGGFLAGLALAGSAVHYEITSKVRSLRDFFLIIFFIILGAGISVNGLGDVIIPALILSAFVLIVKPLIVMGALAVLGYKSRTGFLTSTSLAQLSEFSLILMALALQLGYVDERIAGIITLTTIITIVWSSYGNVYAYSVFEKLKPLLHILEYKRGEAERGMSEIPLKNHVILAGANRLGHQIVQTLQRLNVPFIIVDQNPEVAQRYASQNIPAICGDMTDSHIQELVGLSRAKLFISTIPDFHDNEAIIETAKANDYKTRLIITAQDEDEAMVLYEKDIDYALLPHYVGGLHLAKILEENQVFHSLKNLKKEQLKALQQ